MEEVVKDAILTNESDDRYLLTLLELVMESLSSGRELYDLKDEPVFYRRYLKKWVREGLAERAALKPQV